MSAGDDDSPGAANPAGAKLRHPDMGSLRFSFVLRDFEKTCHIRSLLPGQGRSESQPRRYPYDLFDYRSEDLALAQLR